MKHLINLRFSTAGLDLRAELKPEAMQELLALIEKYRAEDARPSAPNGQPKAFPPLFELDAEALRTKERLGNMRRDELSEVFSTLAAGEERLLLLIGWLEAGTSPPVTKAQVRDLFISLGKRPPANPGRDMKNMLAGGLLARSADGQEMMLEEAGWRRLAKLILKNE